MVFPLVATAIAAVGLVLLGAAGPAYRLGAPLPAAFTMLRWAAYVGIAAAVIGAAAGLFEHRRGRRLGALLGLTAMVAGLVTFGIPYQWQRRAQSAPPIHDITTDLENPPAFKAVVALRAEAPNTLERSPALAAQQREGYPDVALTLPAGAKQVFDRALAVAQEQGWEIVSADQSMGIIEATDTTRWFGFKDDIAVRLTPWGTGTRVDVRSVSRVGLSDVGSNAQRIRDFLATLRE